MKEINMIGEVKMNGQKSSRSLVWKIFTQLNETYAECNYCYRIYNHKTTLSHLLKHARKKHSEMLVQFKNEAQALKNERKSLLVLSADETSNTSWPAVEVLQTDDTESEEKSTEKEDIWSLFTRIDNTFAECNLCQTRLSYKPSITNLTVHKKVEHSGVLLKCDTPEDEPSRNGLCDTFAEENCSLTSQSTKESGSNGKPTARTLASNRVFNIKRSPALQYFTVIDESDARCKICQTTINYQISSSNLMRHIIRKHPLAVVAKAHEGHQKESQKKVADAPTRQPLKQSSISDVEEESDEETSDKVRKIRKNSSDSPNSNQLSGLRHSKRIKKDYPLCEENPMAYLLRVMRSGNFLSFGQGKLGNLSHKFCWEPCMMFMGNQYAEQHISGIHSNPSKYPLCLEERQMTLMTVKGTRWRRKSSVWKIFTKLANGFLCSKCGIILSKKASVGNLMRHIRRAHPACEMQLKVAEQEVSSQNQLPDILPGKTEQAQPIIHTFQRETKSTSTQWDERNAESETEFNGSDNPSGEQLVNIAEQLNPRIVSYSSTKSERTGESQTGCSRSGTTGCPLSERLVHAVEEGNHILRSLQNAVERQGEALSKLVACLEGMNQVQKNNV